MLKLFRYFKPYLASIIAILILVFLQTQSDLYLPSLMSDIINKGVMNGDTASIWQTGGWMLLFAGAGTLCSLLAGFLSAKSAMGFGRDVRNKVFRRVESYSLHEFDKIGTATLITRTTNDITQIQMVAIMILRMMVMAPMMMIGGIIRALDEDRQMTWILVVAMPVLVGTIVFVAGKGFPLFKLMQVKIDRINLVLREKLTGIRVIRAFNRTQHEADRFEQANADLTDNAIAVNKIMAFLMPVLMFIMNLTQLAILWFGIVRIDEGNMQIGSLMAFMQYAMQILFSMLMLSMLFIMLPRASAAAIRVNEILDTEPGILDPENEVACSIDRGHVAFENVSFRYHGAEKPALSGISFTAKPGEVTAIVGSTGSGKTTLVNLLPRFYDVEEGRVLVDGQDVRTMTQECLRRKIGFVPQKALLFSGTIAENIRVGKPDATDEEVRRSAEIAQADEFINAMDGGYGHDISQGGTNVSGGQKQRLSIARALVRRPEIYIFDDSFSALDFKTDARLRAALKHEIAEATVLIVAQRVGTVMDADRIIVLDEGKVVGIGTHRSLLSSCPVYKEIVSSQLSEEEIA
jgi:ATP-binding cassette subfamily B protein